MGSAALDERASIGDALRDALRHAGVRGGAWSFHLQREPFEAKGARAEDFAPGTRFRPGELWHVELAFARPVSGPLLVGDGRFLGLGLFAPAPDAANRAAITSGTGLPNVRDRAPS